MDHQDRNPLIRQDIGGTYCLGFLNRHGLELEEIRSIFSHFGNVLSIKKTGDNCGYRFVRYQNVNEAEKAVEGLSNHPKITIVKPFKNNNSENPINENNRNGNNNKNYNDNRNKFQKDNRYYQNRNFEEKKQHINGKFEEDQNWDEIAKEENQVQNNHKYKSSNSKENLSNQNLCIAKSCNSLNSMLNNDGIKPNVIDMIKTKNEHIKGNSLNSSLSGESLFTEDDYDKLEIPDLIISDKSKITNNASKKIVRNAEEIIVGNIPDNYGTAFILHLFEHYDPIAISNINIVKNSAIRYCHVYFKTAADTLDIEKAFDQMSLSGRQLLVLRPCQLLQKAVC